MSVQKKTSLCYTQNKILCLTLFLGYLFFSVAHVNASEKEQNFMSSSVALNFHSATIQKFQGNTLRELLIRDLSRQIQIDEKEMSFDKIPFSDNDLKHIVSIFDAILQEHTAPVKEWVTANEQVIHQALLTEFESKIQPIRADDPHAYEEILNLITSGEFQDWLQRYSTFIAEAIPLAVHTEVIYMLAPRKAIYNINDIQKKELEDIVKNEFEPFSTIVINALGFSILNLHMLIYEMLNSDSMKLYMPARFNLEKLSQEEKNLRAKAKINFNDKNSIKYRNLVGNVLTNSMRTFIQEIHNTYTPPEQIRKDLRGLAIRAYYSVYSKLPNGCEFIGQWYDVDSIRSSNGDWKKVKHKDGRSISPNDMIEGIGVNVMQPLSTAYIQGCFSEKDPVAAKRTMEDWANKHGDKGKIAAMTHCTLAMWVRYGIGGDRNESAAQEWEARFVRETGLAEGCTSNLPPIDPGNPWLVMN